MKPLTFYFHFSSVNIKSAKTSNYCVFTDYRSTIQIHKTSSVLLNCDRSTLTLAPCKLLRFFQNVLVPPGTRSLLRSDWQLRCPLSYCTPSFSLSSKLFFILLSVFPLSVIRQLFFLNYRHKKIRVLKLLFFCKFALNNIIIIKKVLKFI